MVERRDDHDEPVSPFAEIRFCKGCWEGNVQRFVKNLAEDRWHQLGELLIYTTDTNISLATVDGERWITDGYALVNLAEARTLLALEGPEIDRIGALPDGVHRFNDYGALRHVRDDPPPAGDMLDKWGASDDWVKLNRPSPSAIYFLREDGAEVHLNERFVLFYAVVASRRADVAVEWWQQRDRDHGPVRITRADNGHVVGYVMPMAARPPGETN